MPDCTKDGTADGRLFSGFSSAKKFQVRASDIMAADPLCVTADTPLDEVAYLMPERRIGSATVKGKR